ncbi:MAG TPA: phosphomannomutase/phosphoglucomutase [Phycicoccus elongatus]|uniref:phosphomannomutase/phosphoglucomutase n=1 Tax=Phycicoccus TaxID=367298 RepID=UPI002CA55499|nr:MULTISPECIES: phosphomannomutase/phosphoglucomutase [Phycicoccus]MBK8728473.1 phosphomannomutase/phosphoglucomutase [Tetrasphaera sp.]MCA0321193.1 phosphomannomutase/phosphoglucomutase [Actinomycetota bacterium]HPF75621.1 phosphomannomutase/phosphoglucomutase [Phycicoccus elongatus]HPK11213.1 phosphomannomutase/phosphoglucomutase [Phycicoccus elongatus]HPQ73023.1 phosphomannomutase/phosphoglucomutase [Phycicoccus elongatus]
MSRPPLTDFVKAYDVRGLVPEQLDVDAAWSLGAAFAEVVAVREAARAVVIGHDMRDSSPELSRAFARGVASRGVDVIEIGLASTDGLYYASGSLDLPGAMFTASHNPAAYNGIKLCRAGARPVGQDTGLAEIRDLAQELLDGSAEIRAIEPEGTVRVQDVLADYGTFLRSLVDLSAIRPLKVVVDAGNGMGGHTVPAVLGTAAGLPELPLQIVPLFFELDGSFPNHEANPLDPKNLLDLQAAVVAEGADLGLAFDGDADRCFVVDERGGAVSPSAITGMIARREIGKERAAGRLASDVAIVHNAITSAQVPEIIAAEGARAVRTRVGHSFIKAQMAEHEAVFGGEHSAHYYFRDFWFADTGMLAAMHVLAALGEQDGPLSELMADYSAYVASGEINSTVSDAAAATEKVRAWAADHEVTEDTLDGLTLTHAGSGGDAMWWLNLRASNTEPLLRLNVEAADTETMERVRDDVLAIVRGESR